MLDGLQLLRHVEVEMSCTPVRAVLFDAYGTLCQIADPRRPYQRLSRRVTNRVLFTKAVMTQPLTLRQAAYRAVAQVSEVELSRLEQDLAQELASIRLFPEVVEVLSILKARGYRLGVIANLAQPYALPLQQLLPFELDLYAWSFEQGHPKPHPQFYHWACDGLATPNAATLMVGDTRVPDFHGAQACGLQARWLRRRALLPSSESQTLHDLSSLLDQLP
ncbi:hypothetical protein GCM10027295_36590 [Pseudaeromonas pectinilytica]